jgi:hypothetical protein
MRGSRYGKGKITLSNGRVTMSHATFKDLRRAAMDMAIAAFIFGIIIGMLILKLVYDGVPS